MDYNTMQSIWILLHCARLNDYMNNIKTNTFTTNSFLPFVAYTCPSFRNKSITSRTRSPRKKHQYNRQNISYFQYWNKKQNKKRTYSEHNDLELPMECFMAMVVKCGIYGLFWQFVSVYMRCAYECCHIRIQYRSPRGIFFQSYYTDTGSASICINLHAIHRQESLPGTCYLYEHIWWIDIVGENQIAFPVLIHDNDLLSIYIHHTKCLNL